MKLSLNHFSIRSSNLAASQHFYGDVLGLVLGPRPTFPFPGLWFYAGDTTSYANAVVHIIDANPADAAALTQYLGTTHEGGQQGTGVLDHVAFFATDLVGTLARLNHLGVACRERSVPVLGLHQLFIDDPDGVVVELNFPAAEQAARVSTGALAGAQTGG
jgi:catechol 2,3-dioxygenase-like lactoylglutathione lyase family enzyme